MSGDDTPGLAKPFSPASLTKAVHDTLFDAYAAIPAGKSHAVIFDGTYDRVKGPQMRALYVQRAADGWNVVLEGDYDKPDGIVGKIVIAKAW